MSIQIAVAPPGHVVLRAAHAVVDRVAVTLPGGVPSTALRLTLYGTFPIQDAQLLVYLNGKLAGVGRPGVTRPGSAGSSTATVLLDAVSAKAGDTVTFSFGGAPAMSAGTLRTASK